MISLTTDLEIKNFFYITGADGVEKEVSQEEFASTRSAVMQTSYDTHSPLTGFGTLGREGGDISGRITAYVPDLVIEPGKIYFTSSYCPILILGVLDETTIEYKQEMRFYDHLGRFYDKVGRCRHSGHSLIYDPAGGMKQSIGGGDFLIGEAPTNTAIPLGTLYNKYLSLEQAKFRKDCIAADDPRFVMQYGATYVTRMGMVVRIVYESSKPSDIIGSFGGDNHQMYYSSGKIASDSKTMNDILYRWD